MKHVLPWFVQLFALIILVFCQKGVSQTVLQPGDLVVIGLGANVGGDVADCNTSNNLNSGRDLVSFVCFRDIEPGTTIDITDNGWERDRPGLWGNVEGFLRVTRTGVAIPAGTVVVFEFPPMGEDYQARLPDNGWSFQSLGTNTLNFNSNGDQLYFLQGGIWDNGDTMGCCNGDQNASYTGGRILFGFNSKTDWNSLENNSKDSGLHPDVTPCFHMEPSGGTTNFISYSGLLTPASQLEWIGRISDAANWSTFPDCATFLGEATLVPALQLAPSNIDIGCSVCEGCNEYQDTLVFNLPELNGPFTVEYTDGRDTFVETNLVNGNTITVDINETKSYQILSITSNSGCPLYSDLGEGSTSILGNDLIAIRCMINAPPTSTGGTASVEIEVEADSLTGPFSVEWNGPVSGTISLDSAGTLEISDLPAGEYQVTVMTIDGCSATCSFIMPDPSCNATLNCNIVKQVSTIGGADGEAMLTFANGIPPYQLTWNGPSTDSMLQQQEGSLIISTLPAGTYLVTAADSGGCISTCTFVITQPTCNTRLNLTVEREACNDLPEGEILAELTGATGEVRYDWDDNTLDGLSNPSGLAAGTYVLITEDEVNCRDTAMATIQAPEGISADITTSTEGCDNATGNIRIENITGGSLPYTFSINGSTPAPVDDLPYEATGYPPGNYELIISNNELCDFRTELSVVAGEPLALSIFGATPKIKAGDSTLLEAVSNFPPASVSWEPATGLSAPDSLITFARPAATTTYFINAVDENGCEISTSIVIEVDQTRSLFIPSAFTPNNDGRNDMLSIFGGEDVLSIKSFHVFDRWGSLLFQSGNIEVNNQGSGWDGTFRGQLMPSGTYIYYAEVIFIGNREGIVEGAINLIR